MSRTIQNLVLAGFAVILPMQAAPIVFSTVGADAASIQTTVDSFRTAIGGVNNGNTPGSQLSGRREINWDGGGAAAPVGVFGVPMTTFSNRGNVYTTGGTGFQISGQPDPEFGNINPSYPATFGTFSAPRLFTPTGSNVMDVLFTQPGTTNIPAVTSAFGVVFTDVDQANTTSLQFFDLNGNSLGTYFAAAQNGNATLSFLGIVFDNPSVARVRITTGNAALGAGVNDTANTDLVVMDDFIYAEPQAVPEPSTLLLLGAGLIGLGLRRFRQTSR